MRTILVIAYLMGGQMIDSETLDTANMEDCNITKRLALSENTPITTRYGSDVKISAECREDVAAARRWIYQ